MSAGRDVKLTEVRRLRLNEKQSNKSKLWFQTYRRRMNDGLEWCRSCGVTRDLTFGHIIPHSRGGRFVFDNLTILCLPCNKAEGVRDVARQSLAAEEAIAPADRQWYLLAWTAAGAQGLNALEGGARLARSDQPA